MSQRALDLLEKLAHEHADWIEPYKTIFIGPLAKSDKWEIRLQIVRALPLFQWTPAQARRVDRSGVSAWTESPFLTSFRRHCVAGFATGTHHSAS